MPLYRFFKVPLCLLESHLRQSLDESHNKFISKVNENGKANALIPDLICAGDSDKFVDSLLALLSAWDLAVTVGVGRRRVAHDDDAGCVL